MNKTLSSIIIVVTLLLITFVAGRYAYTAYPSLFGSLFGIPPEVAEAPAAQLGGSLIMTMKPSIPVGSPAAIYAVSPQNGSVKKIDDTHDYFAPSFSSDGRVAVATSIGSSSVALALVKVSDKDHPIFVVPPAPALSPGASSWSQDNKYVVYEAITALPTPGDLAIENSRIVLLDILTGAQKTLDEGVSPLFMKDGSVLYVKSDGIYRIDIQGLVASSSAESAVRVAYFEGYKASRRSKLAVSHDGTKLVAVHPSSNVFIAYTISNPSFSLSYKGSVSERALYPVFSPDDRSIAFIVADTDADGHITKTLMTADTGTLEAHKLLSLAPYTNTALSLAAWVQ
jgi:hypothetical protein